MEDIIINSILIETISHHRRLLYVKLTDGKLLMYNNVPQEIYDEFIKTDSHDEYYKNNIVSKYSAQRIS